MLATATLQSLRLESTLIASTLEVIVLPGLLLGLTRPKSLVLPLEVELGQPVITT
jgi:hypothetical protein